MSRRHLEAFAAAERGDVAAALALWRGGREADPATEAYRLALGAHLSLTGLDVPAPTRTALAALADAAPAAAPGVALACAALETHAVLACDRASLEQTLALHARFDGVDPLGVLGARLWLALFTSTARAADAEALRAEALRRGAAALVVAATAQRALVALAEGDPQAALASARTASRMAATEAMPQSEYLAHLVLARVRRTLGRPHHAGVVLQALARVVPPPWRSWVEWEAGLAGLHPGARAGNDRADDPGDGSTIAALVRAAAAGDRALFVARARALADGAAGWRARRDEAAWLAEALDPDRPVDALDPALQDWARGVAPRPPGGIHGAALLGRATDAEPAVALVLRRPGTPSRRLLAAGAALIGPTERLSSATREGRVDALLAAVALAGDAGAAPEAIFQAVYGFAYRKELHEGTWHVLLHRAREHLAGRGALERHGAGLRLDTPGPLLLEDPRCTPALEDRVLLFVGARPGSGARVAADGLQVPLRTVQRTLQRLVEDGVLQADASGRQVAYAVVDTTFSLPTRWK